MDGSLELVLSPEILDEYRRVGLELGGRYPERATALTPVLTLIAMHASLVNAVPFARCPQCEVQSLPESTLQYGGTTRISTRLGTDPAP